MNEQKHVYVININENGNSFNYATDNKKDMLDKLEHCVAALHHHGYDYDLDGEFIKALVDALGEYDAKYQGLTFEQIIMQIIL